jgi:hypothetical protein
MSKAYLPLTYKHDGVNALLRFDDYDGHLLVMA